MKKIILATISLQNMAGGLERNIIRLANYLASSGYEVDLVTFDSSADQAFYSIDSRVKWHAVGTTRPHHKITFIERWRLIKKLRRVCQLRSSQVTILIAFHHGILFRLKVATLFTKVKLICSERNSLSLYRYISSRKWNLNFFMLFFVSRIVVQFPSFISEYPLLLRRRITAIPNLVSQISIKESQFKVSNQDKFLLLSVGRLCDQKNYPCLILAFKQLSDKYPQWDLVIVGSGNFKNSLQEMIVDLDLQNRVKILDATKDINSWYEKSHIFCTSSRWEGFPNALAEALAHGVPAVGFNGCAGVRDLISNNVNGLLAEGNGQVDFLQTQLDFLMGNPELRQKMSLAAKSSVAKYAPEHVFPKWEKLLDRWPSN